MREVGESVGVRWIKCVYERESERERMTRARFYPGTALRIKRLPWKPVNTTTLCYHTPFYHIYSLSFSLFFTRFLTATAFSAHHEYHHPSRTRALFRELFLTACTGTDPDNPPCPSPLLSLHHNASTTRGIIPRPPI